MKHFSVPYECIFHLVYLVFSANAQFLHSKTILLFGWYPLVLVAHNVRSVPSRLGVCDCSLLGGADQHIAHHYPYINPTYVVTSKASPVMVSEPIRLKIGRKHLVNIMNQFWASEVIYFFLSEIWTVYCTYYWINRFFFQIFEFQIYHYPILWSVDIRGSQIDEIFW